MKSTKRHLGVSLIALIITIAVLVIIAGAVLFRGGLDRIPWAKGGVHDMDKSVVAEAVELYAADKGTYPVIKAGVADVTGSGNMTLGVLTFASAISASQVTDFGATGDNCQLLYDGVWYNVTALTTTQATISNLTIGGTGKAYTLRYTNKVAYENAAFMAKAVTGDIKQIVLSSGKWPANVGPGVQIKFDQDHSGSLANDTKWYDVVSRVSDSAIYIKDDYAGTVNQNELISLRRCAYVDTASYVYPTTYIPSALSAKIAIDLPNVLTKGDGIFEIIDMKALADSNYITKTSDKGFGCYDPTDGSFKAALLNPAGTNTDKWDQIYLRQSTTGIIYYVEGVKAENGTTKY